MKARDQDETFESHSYRPVRRDDCSFVRSWFF